MEITEFNRIELNHKDVMIGNLLETIQKKRCTIISIGEQRLLCRFEEKYTISSEIDFFYPIEINENEIIKLGFTAFQDGWYQKEQITWNIYDKNVRYYQQHFKHITYIHQLQNLFYTHYGYSL